MDKPTHEKVCATNPSDSSVTVQTLSSNKTQMGNIMKKSRWDQPPSDDDNSKDVSKTSVSITKVGSEIRGHSSSVNVESGTGKGSTKELVSKFEIISGSAKRNLPSNKSISSGIEPPTTSEENLGGVVKQREEHEQGKDITDSGADQGLSKTTSRVKLVRTNFSIATQQAGSAKQVKSKEEKGNISFSDSQEEDTNSSSETSHGDEKKESSLKEEMKGISKEQKQDKDESIDKDLPSAEGVITSTALQMISSYNDSPSEDSLSEPENIQEKESLVSAAEKLSESLPVRETKEIDERMESETLNQMESKELNISDTSKEPSVEYGVSELKLHKSEHVKDGSHKDKEEHSEFLEEVSLKPQSSDLERVGGSAVEESGNLSELQSEDKSSNLPDAHGSESISLSCSESKECQLTTEGDKKLELDKVVNETERLTIDDANLNDEDKSLEDEHTSKSDISASESGKQNEHELITQNISNIDITCSKSKDQISELNNMEENEDTTALSTGEHAHELKENIVEQNMKLDEGDIIESSEDFNKASDSLQNFNIQTKDNTVNDTEIGYDVSKQCEQVVNKIDDMTLEGEENTVECVGTTDEKLQKIDTTKENESVYSGLSRNEDQRSEQNEQEKLETSVVCDSSENLAKALQNKLKAKKGNEDEIGMGEVNLPVERDDLNKVIRELVGEVNLEISGASIDAREQENSYVAKTQGTEFVKDVQELSESDSLQNVSVSQTTIESKLSVDLEKVNKEMFENTENETVDSKPASDNDLCIQDILTEDQCTADDNNTTEIPEDAEATESSSILVTTESNTDISKDNIGICEDSDFEISSIPLPSSEGSIQEAKSSDSKKVTPDELSDISEINKKPTSAVSSVNLIDSCEDNAVDGSSVFESVDKSGSEESPIQVTGNIVIGKGTEETSSPDLDKQLYTDFDVSSIPLPDVCEDKKLSEIVTTPIEFAATSESDKKINLENENTEIVEEETQTEVEKQATEVCTENKSPSSDLECMLHKEEDEMELESSVFKVSSSVSNESSKESQGSKDSDNVVIPQKPDETINIQEDSTKSPESNNEDLSTSLQPTLHIAAPDAVLDDKDIVTSTLVNTNSNNDNEVDLKIEEKAVETVKENKVDEEVLDKPRDVCSEVDTEVITCREETTSVCELQSEETHVQEKTSLDSQDMLEEIDDMVCTVTDNINNSEEESLDNVENILLPDEECDDPSNPTAKLQGANEESHKNDLETENKLLQCQVDTITETQSFEKMADISVGSETDIQGRPETHLEDSQNKNAGSSSDIVAVSDEQDIKKGKCETISDQDCPKTDRVETDEVLTSTDEIDKHTDVRNSELTSVDDNRTHKEIQGISKVEKDTKMVDECKSKMTEEDRHSVTGNIELDTDDTRVEENIELRSAIVGTPDSVEYEPKVHEDKTAEEDSVVVLSDKDRKILPSKEKEILHKESLSANVLLEIESSSDNNLVTPVVESCSEELKTSDDILSGTTENILEEGENKNVNSLETKDDNETEKVSLEESGKKEKCQTEINVVESNSELKQPKLPDVSEEGTDKETENVIVSKDTNKIEECNIETAEIKKLPTGEDECSDIKESSTFVCETAAVETIEESEKCVKEEKEVSNQGISEKAKAVLEKAVNIEHTETSKLSEPITAVQSTSKESETDVIKKKQNDNDTSLTGSSNDELVNKNDTAEIVCPSASVASVSSEVNKRESKDLETTDVELPADVKKIPATENEQKSVAIGEVEKNVDHLLSLGKVKTLDSKLVTKAPVKSVSLKRPSSARKDILSDSVTEQPGSTKISVSGLKKQKVSESVQSEKEEKPSKRHTDDVRSKSEVPVSCALPQEQGSARINIEKTGNKEKVQSATKLTGSSSDSSRSEDSSLESKIFKALGDRKEVCITKVSELHKPQKQEDLPGTSHATDSSSGVMKSQHLFAKDGKLFSSQDDVVKELPQVKLEPITLKLSRDNTRAASVSPKKTSDTSTTFIRAESVSPKKTSDYTRSSNDSQLSPKTKTLGYTLKIGKDSTTIVPKESKLSPRIKEHSPGTSSSSTSCLKNTDLSKVEHMLKETGVTITPVSSAETQDTQKLSKITLKLSKAGGHPEIKQDKTKTWKTVQNLSEVDIVPLKDATRTQSVQQFKRKESVESHVTEKKLKLSPTKELSASAGPSIPEQSKPQGLLAKTTHVLQTDSPRSSSSDDVQIVGVIPPKDPLPIQAEDTSSGSAEVVKTLEHPIVKQEVEIRPQPKKRGRPRKVVVPVIPPPVHAKGETDPSGLMFPTPLFNLTDDAFGEGNAAGPPTLFPDQVQPGRRPRRACSGRIKLPVVRSRRPRGSGIVRGVTRGRGRGRGVKRKYDGTEFPVPGSSLTLDNLENQLGGDGTVKVDVQGGENSTMVTSPAPKNENETSKPESSEIKEEVKVKVRRTPKSRKETKRHKREDKRSRKRGGSGSTPIALPPPQMFEEETRMSATESNSRSQTPARATGGDGLGEESQGSLVSGEQSSTIKENNRNKKGRMEVIDLESSKEFTVDQITEYQWPLLGGELWMIQEQISLYLGVKSFKRKYPEIKRRPVEPEERQYLCDNGLVSESMCDLGLTSVSSAEILDIMYQDFQDKYEDFRKHIREKQAKELSNKQKVFGDMTAVLSWPARQSRGVTSLSGLMVLGSRRRSPVRSCRYSHHHQTKEKKKGEVGPQKLDIKEQAIQSAASWNQSFNKSRLEHRRCALDLQTWTIQFPGNRIQKMSRPTPKLGTYPVAVIPGQFCDYYKSYTPQELRYFPLNTVLYGPMKPHERHHMGGSDGSQSESEESSSSDDSSDSSSDGEATCEEEEKDIKDVSPVKSEPLKVQSYPHPVGASDRSVM